MNNTIKKQPGDFEVMPIFTEHDNITISKEAFELAKHMAVEQYKRDLITWLNTEKEKAAKEWDSHADAGRGYFESIWRSKYRQIEAIIQHIEAKGNKRWSMEYLQEAYDFVEKYSDGGELCIDCRFSEPCGLGHICHVFDKHDPSDCPALPDELYPDL